VSYNEFISVVIELSYTADELAWLCC